MTNTGQACTSLFTPSRLIQQADVSARCFATPVGYSESRSLPSSPTTDFFVVCCHKPALCFLLLQKQKPGYKRFALQVHK